MLALLLQQKKGFYPSGLSFPCLHLEKMLFFSSLCLRDQEEG